MEYRKDAQSEFGTGLEVLDDGKVVVDTEFVGSYLAGDGLVYKYPTNSIAANVGQGLCIKNGKIEIDQDLLPLASAEKRGTVRVGSGLAIDSDGVLSATGGTSVKATPLYKLRLKTSEETWGVSIPATDIETSNTDTPGWVVKYDIGFYLEWISFRRKLVKAYAAGSKLHISFSASTYANEDIGSSVYVTPFSQFKPAAVLIGDDIKFCRAENMSFNNVNSVEVEVTVDKDVAAGSYVYVAFI